MSIKEKTETHMTNAYKPYPTYKDSGVEWLENLPSHWKESKLRYLFSFGKGLTITKANLQDEGIPCVNYGEVHSKFGFEVNPEIHTLKCVSEAYLKTDSNALLNKGDIVFADTSEDIEGSGNFTQLVSDADVFAGYHTIIARPDNPKFSRFYAYLLDSLELRTQIRYAVKGVKVFSITQAILRGVNIWLPSEVEREKIANFLDHETARIDTLIAKQETLISLLKEKRQAVISHAVTKGLNPDVEMKDSGVEWLGEVPAHWICTSLKHFANIIDCKHITALFFDEGIPLASIGEVKEKYVNLKAAKLTNDRFYNDLISGGRKPLQGDIIYSRNATVGESALVPENIQKFAMGQDVCLIRHERFLSPEFLLYILKSGLIYQQLDLAMVGSTFKRINVEHIRNFLITVPSLEEQLVITKHLDDLLSQYSSLISKAEKASLLLKERRTALISAAVTGKIDLRDWQAPQGEA